jgi:type IV secretion system protein TrbF
MGGPHRRSILQRLAAPLRACLPAHDEAGSAAPLTAFEHARIEWFERYGCAIVDRDRMFVGWVLTTLALLAACAALLVLMPLKTVEPFVVRVADNGSVVAERAAAQRYQPGRAERTYFVSRWVQQVLTIDPFLTERQLAEAYRMTSGLATQQLLDWMKSDRPIERLKKDAGLHRSVSIVTVAPLDDTVLQVRVRTETRSLVNAALTRTYQITVHYAIVPPKTEAEIIQNPIGLYVTRFNIAEEMS